MTHTAISAKAIITNISGDAIQSVLNQPIRLLKRILLFVGCATSHVLHAMAPIQNHVYSVLLDIIVIMGFVLKMSVSQTNL